MRIFPRIAGVPASSRASMSSTYTCRSRFTKRTVPPPGVLGTASRYRSSRKHSRPGVPGPPTNLCGLRNTASYPSGRPGFMSMVTYGPLAAKSKNAYAPCACRMRATERVSVSRPVTLLAALNDPILGRPA